MGEDDKTYAQIEALQRDMQALEPTGEEDLNVLLEKLDAQNARAKRASQEEFMNLIAIGVADGYGLFCEIFRDVATGWVMFTWVHGYRWMADVFCIPVKEADKAISRYRYPLFGSETHVERREMARA